MDELVILIKLYSKLKQIEMDEDIKTQFREAIKDACIISLVDDNWGYERILKK